MNTEAIMRELIEELQGLVESWRDDAATCREEPMGTVQAVVYDECADELEAMIANDADTQIHVITEPTVYLLGKQLVNDEELNRFLSDHGVAWESDSEIAAEVMTETAGREKE